MWNSHLACAGWKYAPQTQSDCYIKNCKLVSNWILYSLKYWEIVIYRFNIQADINDCKGKFRP
jgi:hypothetical protein